MKEKRSLRQAMRTRSRWLTPGMGVKRWLVLLGLGAAAAGMGLVYLLLILRREGWLPQQAYDLLTLQGLPVSLRVVLPLLVGGLVILLSIMRLGTTLLEPFRRPGDSLLTSLYQHSRRSRGPAIAAIGGGTGLPSLIRGLKDYTHNITAIVTVADDGGSSGRLRQELGMLPPGDFRNNLAALAQDEPLMTEVLQYRFEQPGLENGRAGLRGHALGNLLLAALTEVTGSFDRALLAAERVLALRGRVLPATLEDITLVAEVAVGGKEGKMLHVVGESSIPEAGGQIQSLVLEPAEPTAYLPAVAAILEADIVVLGPGSLYTSILPNLLVKGIANALQQTEALRVYVCNLATQPGETDGFSAGDHVAEIVAVLGWGMLDVVVANDNLTPASANIGNTVFVLPEWGDLELTGPTRFMTADLVDEVRPWRHDSQKLAQIVRRIAEGDFDD